MTVVVVDTGDIDAIAQYQPQDATTNPTLILKAAELPQYHDLLESSLQWARRQVTEARELCHWAAKKLMVDFGVKILQIIPGRVSTEVDSLLSFDVPGTVQQAQELIALYQQAGVDRKRVLIKIAATWEGIQAAKILEKQGIHCNLTLMFDLAQAIACAEAGVTLISPFVGRILDWYQKNQPQNYTPENDPGVLSVNQIYRYLHDLNYPTVVMGASFRNTGQIKALAGCDYLTISPGLLNELKNETGALSQRLLPIIDSPSFTKKIIMDEKTFRWQMNVNSMATEKLAEGIRLFHNDMRQLESRLRTIIISSEASS